VWTAQPSSAAPSTRGCLEIALAAREQIDWDDVRERSAASPSAGPSSWSPKRSS